MSSPDALLRYRRLFRRCLAFGPCLKSPRVLIQGFFTKASNVPGGTYSSRYFSENCIYMQRYAIEDRLLEHACGLAA